MSPVDPFPGDLRQRLPALMLRDRRRLERRLDGLGRRQRPGARGDAVERIAADVERAERRVERRRAAAPTITYPPALPVSRRRDDLAAAIRDSQVVVVAGETGSGKTTQLPKICLELGRGVSGLIGHTQPRRLAARAVAERIAEELSVPLGGAVGYQVRFTDRVGEDTLVKLMTDGILLAEIQNDRLLDAYDTLILDEAHERSLNVDFLLGYVRRLLPRRPDLKVIITSATIDPERFSHHFDDAPIVEVSGRTYPVEVRYRPLDEGPGGAGEGADEDGAGEDPDGEDPDGEDGAGDGGSGVSGGSGAARDQRDQRDQARDRTEAIRDAVDELIAEGPGDVLVFLSGEREIRDTADALREAYGDDIEVLPLYARLSAAEQHRVFRPSRRRRVVLATNVAETSLTVPGIRYVVDPGTARISRYSTRLKVQRLPVEPISQASADQRKGRCGRVADGICIRLYSDDDFRSRPAFTDPEILRTSLASVILQMAALGLGDVAAFPFVDPPDPRAVRDGVLLLRELGALDPSSEQPRLTPLGRRLARLPLDPRLGRMVLEADRNGCVDEVLVITAALSIRDPRERPVDRRAEADAHHARFADEDSDFLSYLHLWHYLRERRAALSSGAFRRMCRAEFLHAQRVREWQDLHDQLRSVVAGLGMSLDDAPADDDSAGDAPDALAAGDASADGTIADPARISRSLLAGLLSHVGMYNAEKREYVGARGARFAISPGSALFRRSPRWVMAAELTETTRLWAHVVARIRPEDAERAGAHLVKRTYGEPRWDAERGAVVAIERVTLYGVPLVTSRRVDYGRIDPRASRELFLRRALVEGDWRTSHAFWHENRRALRDVEALAHRARRPDLVVGDEALFAFYDARVGEEAVSARSFDRWWKQTRERRPDLLTLPRSALLAEAAGDLREEDYPQRWGQGDLTLRLSYRFAPGSADDGVTVHVPLTALNRVRPDGFDWQVPGLRAELVTALLRSLPKDLRRQLVPVPDTARAVLARLVPDAGADRAPDASGGTVGGAPSPAPLLDALERAVRATTGVVVPRAAWQPDRLPPHLRMTFRVEDEHGRAIAQGEDLAALQRRLAPRVRATIAEAAGGVERTVRGWSFGTLPRTIERVKDGTTVRGHPALVDEGDRVAVRVLASEAEQRRATWRGTRRLLLLNLPSPATTIRRRLDTATKLALSANPHGSVAALLDDCVTCAADDLLARHGGPVEDEAAFGALLAAVRPALDDAVLEILDVVARVLTAASGVGARLEATTAPALRPAVADLRAQLAGLVYPGFVTATGRRRLPDVERYLHAMQRRLDALPRNAARDAARMERIAHLQESYRRMLDALPRTGWSQDAVRQAQQVRWMIEELRVSEFAQALGTAQPVSEQRIRRAMGQLVA